MANTAPEAERLARADFCRFLAACYYEPGPEFAEERLFESMHAAATRIDPAFSEEVLSLHKQFDGETLEALLVDYTRLFLAPPMLAKPYASAWLNGARAEDPATAVLGFYAEGGFAIDEGFRELPDHVAAELEFLYLLIHQDAEDLRGRFLAQHLGRWIRPFLDAVQAGAATAFYRELAQLTERAVAGEASRVATR